ncbi:MAG: MarC family protein [Myxococcales bacterium]
MKELLSFWLVPFSAIFFVVDPPGLVPIFLAITRQQPPEKRAQMARKATLVAFGLLTSFALFGGVIFAAFGITLGAFKIAGGLLLLLTAIDMLRAQPSRTRSSPDEQREGEEKEDVAIVPLAMPLLAGPGAIATVMVLVGRGGGSWLNAAPVILAAGITCAVAYAMMRAAPYIDRVLGRSGLAILERVMGLLLAAIAVQFFADGVSDLYVDIRGRA